MPRAGGATPRRSSDRAGPGLVDGGKPRRIYCVPIGSTLEDSSLSSSQQSVIAVTDDLTFRSRIEQSLGRAGISVRFVPAQDLAESLRADRPILALLDYASYGGAAVEALARAKVDPLTRGIPVLAYGPHMDLAGRHRAKAAGADGILSNAQVASDLPALVRRWAGPREEESL